MNQIPSCFIVGAGIVDPGLRLTLRPGDLLIAADGGLSAVEHMSLTPDLVIGDFDSLGQTPTHSNTIVLPCEKDVTDMHAAIDAGLERGYTRFALYGGTGGRLAHTLANLQLLDRLAQKGCRGFLAGNGTVATAVANGSLCFPAGMSGYLSVFCNSGAASGVTLSGLKYELTDAALSGTFPMGVSNEFTDAPALVRVERGSLLVLWQGDTVDRDLLSSL